MNRHACVSVCVRAPVCICVGFIESVLCLDDDLVYFSFEAIYLAKLIFTVAMVFNENANAYKYVVGTADTSKWKYVRGKRRIQGKQAGRERGGGYKWCGIERGGMEDMFYTK